MITPPTIVALFSGILVPLLIVIVVVSAIVGYSTLMILRRLRIERDSLLKEKDIIFEYVQSIGEVFTESEELETGKLLQKVLFYALRTTHAGGGAIYLLGDDNQLRAEAISGVFPPLVGIDVPDDFDLNVLKSSQLEDLIRAKPVGVGEGLVGQTADFGTPLLIGRAERDPRVPHFPNSMLDVRSILLVPMRFRHNVTGVVAVVNRVDGIPLSERDQSLLQALADQASVPVYYAQFRAALREKRRLDRDLNLAMRIQARLLPGELPRVPGLSLAAFNLPALEVGGDYYDVIEIDEAHMGMAIADVSGKGVGGAIMMSICRSVLRAHGPGHHDPAEVLRAVNRTMAADIYEDMFVTMIYMIYNVKTGELRVAKAGHDPALVLNGETGEVQELGAGGLGIGMGDAESFDLLIQSSSMMLPPDSVAVIYTDGITEAMNANEEEWGVELLEQTLREGRQLPPEKLLKNIRERVLRFTGDLPQYDDMTILAMRTAASEHPSK